MRYTYLSLFEKVHFLGEDADEEGEPSSDARNRKSNASVLVQVPMFYNRAQHDIPESQRLALGLAASLGPPSEYNKLCLSLLSGLPNEEALSLNVCTLLSNEGRHALRLDRVPRLLDLLLAQAGLFSNDDPTLRPTLLECWQGVEGRRMERFWEDNLDADTVALFNIGRGNKDDDDELFNLNYEVGTRSIEGQRVLRIALIFHNLSFEERNVSVLARNRTFIRFVMLCALSRWSSLRQVALDTIGNLASKLVLYPGSEDEEEEEGVRGEEEEEEAGERQRWSCALLRLAREGVQSQDRYLVVRCLDILARLCRQERNARALLPQLDAPLCRRIFELLTVHDLMLLIYALEALYMLSEMGRDACERLLLVHKSIGILVSLLTLDPLAYGPLAQKGMKLIETVDPLLPPAMPVTGPSSSAPPPHPRVAAAMVPHPPPEAAPSPSPVLTLGAAPSPDPLDTEAFAGTWVRAMYEPAPPGCSVARNDIYAEYVTFCSKAGRKSVISASVFANCVKAVYSQTGIRRVDNANGMMSFHHDGLRKRLNPLPVPIQVTSCLSITTQGSFKGLLEGSTWGRGRDLNGVSTIETTRFRYLSLFEKVHFLGEDADEEGEPSSDARNRKSNASVLVQVPMFYNRAQHDIPESQRLALGLAASLGPPSEYNKLCLSLLSGLPNEEALSLNVCTLLSNEGRHALRLDRVPRLLDLLLAQAGLFSNDDPTLRPTLLECWQGVEGRRMERFWEDNLDADTVALFNIGRGNKDDDDELFNLNYEVGTRSIEGQRVLRIALIFHNLSFEERNVSVLARNRTFIRFVMLCALSRWSSLRQVALDTIGNLASKLVLYPGSEEEEEEEGVRGEEEEEEAGERQRWSCALLRLAREGVQSQDRYLVVRCLDILARLCRQERNARALLPQLDAPLCRRIFELLTVHDLMLLIYALEALYMLSEMGRDACERLLLVHKSIGILVSLLTLDPLAYGPLAQKGMKLIETVDPLLPPAMPVTGPSSSAPPPHPRVAAAMLPHPPPEAAPSPSPVLTLGAAPSPDPLDTEAFAGTWVRAMYEPAPPGCSVARNDIYAEYVTFCSKAGRKSVISASVFANCVKAVYSQTGIRRVDNANGMMSFHHDGLRKRLNPLPVPIQVTSCLSITTQGSSSFLSLSHTGG
ncbi:AT-rich interactive domain-containing protein 2 [Ixodes scapularis]